MKLATGTVVNGKIVLDGAALPEGTVVTVLAPEGDGSTRFTVREEYTGPLLPMIWKSMPDLGPSFARFADGLKARAERGG